MMRHSAIPVSDEKDMSLPLAAMLTIVMSVYRVAINSRNLAHEAPLIAVKGKTRATTPFGRIFRSARSAKADASPA